MGFLVVTLSAGLWLPRENAASIGLSLRHRGIGDGAGEGVSSTAAEESDIHGLSA